MSRYFLILLGALLGAQVLPAQTPNPLSAELHESYTIIKNYLLKMADKMPEQDYAFRPVPAVETFGRRVAHIAGANYRTCSGLDGDAQRLDTASKTSKADLVALLKQSFAACDRVFDSLTDVSAVQKVDGRLGSPPSPGQMRTRLSILWNVVRHSNELYGYMSVYLRMNGVVPPSSEPRTAVPE
ncbi:MAG TPA: DinB family protein [Bryobacteraceae bacterium]|nr:DinB family protein [Bryobacteraceae bacterium]